MSDPEMRAPGQEHIGPSESAWVTAVKRRANAPVESGWGSAAKRPSSGPSVDELLGADLPMDNLPVNCASDNVEMPQTDVLPPGVPTTTNILGQTREGRSDSFVTFQLDPVTEQPAEPQEVHQHPVPFLDGPTKYQLSPGQLATRLDRGCNSGQHSCRHSGAGKGRGGRSNNKKTPRITLVHRDLELPGNSRRVKVVPYRQLPFLCVRVVRGFTFPVALTAKLTGNSALIPRYSYLSNLSYFEFSISVLHSQRLIVISRAEIHPTCISRSTRQPATLCSTNLRGS